MNFKPSIEIASYVYTSARGKAGATRTWKLSAQVPDFWDVRKVRNVIQTSSCSSRWA